MNVSSLHPSALQCHQRLSFDLRFLLALILLRVKRTNPKHTALSLRNVVTCATKVL